MKTKLKEQKIEEKEFHDKLRSLKKDDSDYGFYTSNKKFYSIARRSRSFVNEWLKSLAGHIPSVKRLNVVAKTRGGEHI